MDSTRNMILAILITAIAVGVFYMIDPTFMGLLGRKEGFDSGDVTYTNGPASSDGMHPEAFVNDGNADKKEQFENAHNDTPMGTTESPMMPTEGFENLAPASMPFASAERPGNCYPKNQLAPSELLPGDANSKWAQVNPMGAGDVAGKNFLNAGALVGVNTVSSSLRNASWDLRSSVPNPQQQVSPWMQTTIQPEISRRPLEIA